MLTTTKYKRGHVSQNVEDQISFPCRFILWLCFTCRAAACYQGPLEAMDCAIIFLKQLAVSSCSNEQIYNLLLSRCLRWKPFRFTTCWLICVPTHHHVYETASTWVRDFRSGHSYLLIYFSQPLQWNNSIQNMNMPCDCGTTNGQCWEHCPHVEDESSH